MTLEPFILYVNDEPRAITWGQNPAHALEAFRTAMLGQPVPEKVVAVSAWQAPIDELVRVALLGLYARMFQGDMQQAMQAAAAQQNRARAVKS